MKTAFLIDGKPIFKYGDHGKESTYDVHVPQFGMMLRGMTAATAKQLIKAWNSQEPVEVIQDTYTKSDIYVFWKTNR